MNEFKELLLPSLQKLTDLFFWSYIVTVVLILILAYFILKRFFRNKKGGKQ